MFLLATIITILSIMTVALPLILRRRSGSSTFHGDSAKQFIIRRENIYKELASIKMDYEIGNLSLENYKNQVKLYRLEAAKNIKQQELLEISMANLDDKIEKAILVIRNKEGSK